MSDQSPMNHTIKKLIDSISKENAKNFKDDLLKQIATIGISSISKNDLLEYILFLANKYSTEKIIDKSSNFTLAIAFKTTETKIKSTKLNIALKYQQINGDPISVFLGRITKKEIILDEKDDCYSFVIEDRMIRMCLENDLKEQMGTTLNYQENHELVYIDKTIFLEYLQKRSGMSADLFISEYLQKKLEKEKGKNYVKNLGKGIAAFARDVSANVLAAVIANMVKPC